MTRERFGFLGPGPVARPDRARRRRSPACSRKPTGRPGRVPRSGERRRVPGLRAGGALGRPARRPARRFGAPDGVPAADGRGARLGDRGSPWRRAGPRAWPATADLRARLPVGGRPLVRRPGGDGGDRRRVRRDRWGVGRERTGRRRAGLALAGGATGRAGTGAGGAPSAGMAWESQSSGGSPPSTTAGPAGSEYPPNARSGNDVPRGTPTEPAARMSEPAAAAKR